MPPYGSAAAPQATSPWPEYAAAPEAASRRTRVFVILGVVAILAVGGLAAVLAVSALRTSDAAIPSAGTIVIPQTLGGMAQSNDPTVKLITAGIQSEAQSSMKGVAGFKAMGYGDVSKFALLMVVQSAPGQVVPTADQVLRGIIGQAEGQKIAAGATMSFTPPKTVGDGSCVTQSVSTSTVTKVVGTTCARIVGVEAILVMSQPADATATVGMVDAAATAQ